MSHQISQKSENIKLPVILGGFREVRRRSDSGASEPLLMVKPIRSGSRLRVHHAAAIAHVSYQSKSPRWFP